MSAYRLQLTSESASSVSRRLLALAAEAQEHLAANYRSIASLTVPASLRAQRLVEFHPPKPREQSALLRQPSTLTQILPAPAAPGFDRPNQTKSAVGQRGYQR